MPKLGCSTKLLIVALVFLVLLIAGVISGALGRSLLGSSLVPENLLPPRPHPGLPAEEIHHLFSFSIFDFSITNTIVAAWFTIVVLALLALLATRKVKLIPSGLQNLLEAGLEMLLNFVEGIAGKKNGRRFFPVVATIFIFVMMNAWLSLVPGFNSLTFNGVHLLRGANTDINLPLALALASFVFVEYWGATSLGFFRYMSKFINLRNLFRGRIVVGAIEVFVGVLEAMSELVRLVSFTFRLFGNMTAGELLLLIVAFLVPWVAVIPFYGLELLVGFVQALIFSGLTLIFATTAVAAHGGEPAK